MMKGGNLSDRYLRRDISLESAIWYDK